MKIDLFCHLFPKNFYDRMLTVSGKSAHMQKRVRGIPCIVDLDLRFRMMDRFPDYVQVICLRLRRSKRWENRRWRPNWPRSPMTVWPNSSSSIRIAFRGLSLLWP